MRVDERSGLTDVKSVNRHHEPSVYISANVQSSEGLHVVFIIFLFIFSIRSISAFTSHCLKAATQLQSEQ